MADTTPTRHREALWRSGEPAFARLRRGTRLRAAIERAGLWHMDHGFVHDPRAIEVILLTPAMAFLTPDLFFERNLKPQARRHLTRRALARRLAGDLAEIALQPSG